MTDGRAFRQNGHLPRRCFSTRACHSWSSAAGHFHQTIVSESRGDVSGGERAVARRMPKRRERRVAGSKVVGRARALTRTKRAPRAADAVDGGRLPLVVPGGRAPPPKRPVGACDDLLRTEPTVSARMKLRDESRVKRGEAVGPACAKAPAEWATRCARALGHRGLPFVVLGGGALPPEAPLGPGDDVLRTQPAVAARVKLLRKRREKRVEAVGTAHAKAAAEWATRRARAVPHRGFPSVVLRDRAPPPYSDVRPNGDVPRRESAVPLDIPLRDEVG